jgi:putative peptidoglycan lipid II flippase
MLTLPLMLGVSLVTVDEWLLKYFGSMQQEGAITWINNGRKLMLMAFAIIGQAAGQAALPYLTRLYHEGKIDEMGRMLGISLQRVIFLAATAACGLVAIAVPVVYLIFRRGQFTLEDAALTAQMLTIFAVGLPAWATQAMIARGFYARKDTLTPMIIGTVVVAISAPCYYLLNESYGVTGLPIATSIGITLNACTLLIVYKVRYQALDLTMPLTGLLRGLLFGAVCGVPAYFVGNYLFDAQSQWVAVGALAAVFSVFGVIAGVLVLIRTPPELEFVIAKLKRRFS